MGCKLCTDDKSNLQTVSTQSEGHNRSQKLHIATEIDPSSLFKKFKILRDFTECERQMYQTHSRVMFNQQEMKVDGMKYHSVSMKLGDDALQNVYLAQASHQTLIVTKIEIKNSST
jgi:hypothetical protein